MTGSLPNRSRRNDSRSYDQSHSSDRPNLPFLPFPSLPSFPGAFLFPFICFGRFSPCCLLMMPLRYRFSVPLDDRGCFCNIFFSFSASSFSIPYIPLLCFLRSHAASGHVFVILSPNATHVFDILPCSVRLRPELRCSWPRLPPSPLFLFFPPPPFVFDSASFHSVRTFAPFRRFNTLQHLYFTRFLLLWIILRLV